MAKKRSLAALVLAVATFWAATSPALAAGPDACGHSTLGECVSAMAPEHPRANGAAFGEHVSMMARGECPHAY